MAAVSPTVAPAPSASAGAPEIVVLDGDQTGQELLEQALRVLDPSAVRLPLRFERFDLSVESRRRTANQVITDAAQAIRRTGLGLKAATITPAGVTLAGASASGGPVASVQPIDAGWDGAQPRSLPRPNSDDVGSPNALLREAIDGTVILRTGRRLPNVRPLGGVHAPISVVRM